jgi:hypothetical protein
MPRHEMLEEEIKARDFLGLFDCLIRRPVVLSLSFCQQRARNDITLIASVGWIVSVSHRKLSRIKERHRAVASDGLTDQRWQNDCKSGLSSPVAIGDFAPASVNALNESLWQRPAGYGRSVFRKSSRFSCPDDRCMHARHAQGEPQSRRHTFFEISSQEIIFQFL